MSGVVVVAGVFQPGSVVTLYAVPDERVLRPEGHDVVGQRLADERGNVGWDGLDVGARFLAAGYVSGNYVIVRLLATDAERPDSELFQPPVQTTPQKLGTQEATPPDESPAPPDGELQAGVPEGVVSPVLDQLWLNSAGGDVDPLLWARAGVQTPAETAADGSQKASQPLYRFVGAAAVAGVPEGWERYEGRTEPEGQAEEAHGQPEAPPAEPAPAGNLNIEAPPATVEASGEVPPEVAASEGQATAQEAPETSQPPAAAPDGGAASSPADAAPTDQPSGTPPAADQPPSS